MSKYKVGSVVQGSVTGIESYGIFIGLDDYYSGLIHISEISNNFVKDINEIVEIGEVISVKVLDIDEDAYHLKLSIKDIKYKQKKFKEKKIVEIGSGFGILSSNLDKWIEEKKASNEQKT